MNNGEKNSGVGESEPESDTKKWERITQKAQRTKLAYFTGRKFRASDWLIFLSRKKRSPIGRPFISLPHSSSCQAPPSRSLRRTMRSLRKKQIASEEEWTTADDAPNSVARKFHQAFILHSGNAKRSSAGFRWQPANDPNFSLPLRKCKLPISPLLECRFSWPKMPFRILHQARRTPKIPFRPLQTDFLAPKSRSGKILSKSHNINKLGENKRAESCGAFFGRRRARISVSFLPNPEKSPSASHPLSFLYVFVWKYTK